MPEATTNPKCRKFQDIQPDNLNKEGLHNKGRGMLQTRDLKNMSHTVKGTCF